MNTLEVSIYSNGFGKNCKLVVDIRSGICLDEKNQLPINPKCPWVMNGPEHKKDAVVSPDGRRIMSASFFRTRNRNVISAPLKSDEEKYIHSQNREILIRTEVPIEHALFVQDIFNDKSIIEDNNFLDHDRNCQLHDANHDGSLILMRVEVGQILRLWTRDGIVSLGLETNGRIRYIFGRNLPDDFIQSMEVAHESLQEARQTHFEMVRRRLGGNEDLLPHAHLFAEVEGKLQRSAPAESGTFTPSEEVVKKTLPSQEVIVPLGKKVIPVLPRRKKAPRPSNAVILTKA